MILDVNAYLGHFAFRPLRHNTAAGLLRLMDAKGIDQAVVSSASAITYRNSQSGNEEVAAEIERHRDRLFPFAVVNPFYVGWRDDLKACHEEMGARGLRLYPRWHHYELSDPVCLELIHEATERGMVVSIPIRVEDVRQRSWLVDVPEVPLDELAQLAAACPGSRFIFCNGRGYTSSPLANKDGKAPANYLLEISRIENASTNGFERHMAEFGADRLVFGTGMPFNYPDPALLRMEILDAAGAEKEKIYWRNAAQWGLGKS